MEWSFHSLATRIRRKVDRFGNAANKDMEYFMKFRLALPVEPYRKAIDIGCGDKWELKEAMKIAGRLRIADADAAAATAAAAPGAMAAATLGERSVSFASASMSDDRLKAIERSIQELNLTVENLQEEKRNEARRREEWSRGRSEDRSQSRERDNRSSDRFRHDSPRSYQGRDDRGRDYDDRRYSHEHSHRDSRGQFDRRGPNEGQVVAHRNTEGRDRSVDYRTLDFESQVDYLADALAQRRL